MFNVSLLRILLSLTIAIFSVPAFAAGFDSDYGATSKMPASYVKAVKVIRLGNYQEAIVLLESANNKIPKDTDIINLLGFTHRKIGDLGKAGNYCSEALKIDSEHKGALDYQGELFLLVGNKAAAKENLKKLDKICWLGCGELDDLRTELKSINLDWRI
jgi:tetratricopeptide (TPR) repeat protein